MGGFDVGGFDIERVDVAGQRGRLCGVCRWRLRRRSLASTGAWAGRLGPMWVGIDEHDGAGGNWDSGMGWDCGQGHSLRVTSLHRLLQRTSRVTLR